MLLIFHHNFGSDFDLLDTVRSGLDSSNSNIRTFAFMGLVSTVVFDWRKNSCWWIVQCQHVAIGKQLVWVNVVGTYKHGGKVVMPPNINCPSCSTFTRKVLDNDQFLSESCSYCKFNFTECRSPPNCHCRSSDVGIHREFTSSDAAVAYHACSTWPNVMATPTMLGACDCSCPWLGWLRACGTALPRTIAPASEQILSWKDQCSTTKPHVKNKDSTEVISRSSVQLQVICCFSQC
jgi:hypothetical protein